MTAGYTVRTTPRFERLLRRLLRRHPELLDRYADAVRTWISDLAIHRGLTRTRRKVLASFQKDLDPNKIDLEKTYTDEFARNAMITHR